LALGEGGDGQPEHRTGHEYRKTAHDNLPCIESASRGSRA
jgi:hypothetical protein